MFFSSVSEALTWATVRLLMWGSRALVVVIIVGLLIRAWWEGRRA